MDANIDLTNTNLTLRIYDICPSRKRTETSWNMSKHRIMCLKEVLLETRFHTIYKYIYLFICII